MQHVASFSLIASFRSKADVKIMNNLLGSGSTQQFIVSSVSIGLVWNSFDPNLIEPDWCCYFELCSTLYRGKLLSPKPFFFYFLPLC